MKWFLKCIRNYVNFSGRARRTEFWYFILFSCLLLIVAMALDVVCFNTPYGVFYLLVAYNQQNEMWRDQKRKATDEA